MYRAVTLYALRNGFFRGEKIDREQLHHALPEIQIGFRRTTAEEEATTLLNGVDVEQDIRRKDVAALVSSVAALPFVRKALVTQQQEMGRDGGVVMDGRDIGTTVFPQAELKIFVTADPHIRAQRRLDEMHAKGEHASFVEVLANIKERDYQDSTRRESPLRQAPDALLLDTSAMTIAEQKDWLLRQYAATVGQPTGRHD
jgi:cytidylate kinase